MRREIERLDNLYYAQYAWKLESYAGYDSDNDVEETRDVLTRSRQELGDQDRATSQRNVENVASLVEEEGMKVRLRENYVKFVYEYRGNEVLGIEGFRFKITLVYRGVSRKWYVSPGRSFVPEAICLEDMLKSGTHNPTSEEALHLVRDVRRSIDVFMARLTNVHRFMRDARRSHKDMQFHVDPTVRKMRLIFSENAWPAGLRQLSLKDTIVVKLTLSKNMRVRDIAYEYICACTSEVLRNEYIKKLQFKLHNFYDFPLREAFERFMGEGSYTEQENSMED